MKKVMKNKKILLIIFSLLLIAITSFCIAINKKGNVFYNLVHKQEKLADDEIELDNWEISTVFYDSTVNNGKTPLTEINWDSVTRDEKRSIKVQIKYKNTNTQKDYRGWYKGSCSFEEYSKSSSMDGKYDSDTCKLACWKD